jgi:hypothetical protein
MVIGSKINFRKPRQKEWGIISNNNLTQLNYGGVTDSAGNPINSFSTNCYNDALEQLRILLASGSSSTNLQLVEFVPYDYIMQPRV